jgi:protein-tyrosine phosphatase
VRAAEDARGVVDLHSHLMPGVDDGAIDIDESRAALEHLRAEGVVALVTTPPVAATVLRRAEAWAQRRRELDEAWDRLCACVPEGERPMLHRGVELRLDDPQPDLSDPSVRMAGGSFVLVEFPYFTIPPRSTSVMSRIRRDGFVPIIAHPERYAGILEDEELIGAWRENGAYLQVNGRSLIGRYGAEARAAAYRLLAKGWVDYLGSDYHARGRSEIRSYCSLVDELGDPERTRLLTETNPQRLIASEMPLPVQPIERGLWQRVRDALGA